MRYRSCNAKEFDDSFMPNDYKIFAVGKDSAFGLSCYENDQKGIR